MLPTGRTALVLLASLGAVPVDATPAISFPINSQVPPVARISQPFSYVFPSTTFTSSSGSPLFYSLKDPPSWLSIDSDNRRLYGTPQDAEIAPGTVVGVPIVLVATDSTGSTPLSVTLVVSRSPGPAVHVPVSDQMQKFGHYSEPSSILLYPDRDFLFAFAPDTFIDTQVQSLNYYAVTINNSPLPAWVSFDAGTLAFSGTTPPFASLIEPPQTFSLKLVASDVKGFSAASIAFSIVVGSHALTVTQPRITLNATVGIFVYYAGLLGSVTIDGQPASVSDVPRVTTENLPPWLVFDPSSWAIAGTPPDTAQSTSFSIIMEDEFADKLNITFDVVLAKDTGGLFQGSFPTVSLDPGDHLSFDLKPYLFDPSGSGISVEIQPSTPWIVFDPSSLVLSGDVPTSAPSSVIEVVFNAWAENRRLERDETIQSQKLTIQILSDSEPTTASTGALVPWSPTTSASSTASATPGNQSAQNATTNVVLIAILVPLILGLLFAICFGFCCYRRRQRRLSRTPLEGKDSCGPEPTSYTHTQGYDPEASRLDLSEQHFVGLTSSPAEKCKPRKPSNLRAEYTGSPVPEAPAPALPIIVHDAPTHDALPSKYRDLMAPLRNFRIPRLKRGNTRTSSDSFDEDDGRGFSMDHPPSITLRQSRQSSFRSEVEISIPSLDADHSPLQTPEAAYAGSATRPAGSSGHYHASPATPVDRGPPPRNPARVHSDLGSSEITPINESELIIEKTRPGPGEPKMREHPALRHAKSQRSFLSFSSADTFRGTRRLAGKATASAKGAASLASAAVQRKTLKAWGKVRLHVHDSPHARQGIFDNVTHSRTEFGKFDQFGSSGGYMSLRDPGVPATVPTPRVATAPVALNSESHRRRQSRMNGSIGGDSRSSRAMSVGAGENRISRGDPGTVRRRRGSGSYDIPQFPATSPRGSYTGLGIVDYEGLVSNSPFHPSRDSRGRAAGRPPAASWATTQMRFSMASSMDRPFTAKTAQTTQTFSSMRDSRNWVVHQVSPMESPMENRLESPVLPSPGSGGPQRGGFCTATEMTPTRMQPAEPWKNASSRQDSGGGAAATTGNEIKRKSVTQSGKSGTSKGSDGPPAFI
jgi:hypothetical protein